MNDLDNKRNGFTLIELLIASSLSLIVIAALGGLIIILGENRVSVFQNYAKVEQTNSSLTSIIREVRNVNQGENGSYALVRAEDQEFIFYTDYDFDGQAERVRYTMIDTNLEKGVTEPSGFPFIYDTSNEKTRIIATNVQNQDEPIFYYYNGDWPGDTTNNPLPTPSRLSDTKVMRILLKLNDSPNDPENDFVLESYVQLRNLKQNL